MLKKALTAIQILRREVKKKMYVKIFNLYDASHF
jgi:ribosomal protein L31E